MKPSPNSRLERHRFWPISVLLLLSNSVALADIEFHPGVEGQILATDNIDLDTTKQREGVVELTPGFQLESKGIRHHASLDYGLRGRYYPGDKDLSYNHSGKGLANIDLIRDYLSVYGSGGVFQRSNSLTNAQLMDTKLLLTDFSDVGNAAIGVKARNQAQRYFSTNADYQYAVSRSNSPTYADTQTQRGLFVVQQGTDFQRTIWKLQGKGDLLQNSITEDRITASATADLGYLIKKGSGMFGSFGYELNPGITGQGTREATRGYVLTGTLFWLWAEHLDTRVTYGKRSFGEAYSAQASWQQNETFISAQVSKEVIGDTWSLALKKRIRQLQINLSYNETLTNPSYSVQELGLAPDLANDGTFAIDEDTNTPIVNQVIVDSKNVGTYIRRLGRAEFILTGVHNVIKLSGNLEKRDFIEIDKKGLTKNVEFSWTNHLTPLANIRLELKAEDLNDTSIRANALYGFARVAYEHKLGKYLTTGAQLVHWEKRPPDAPKASTNIALVNLKAVY